MAMQFYSFCFHAFRQFSFCLLLLLFEVNALVMYGRWYLDLIEHVPICSAYDFYLLLFFLQILHINFFKLSEQYWLCLYSIWKSEFLFLGLRKGGIVKIELVTIPKALT